MKTFKIMGKYTPKDSTIAGKGLQILECNELQEMILTKVRKSGKSKDYSVRSMICRATLDTNVFKGRFILIDSKFKGLTKLQQTALILRENILERNEMTGEHEIDPRAVAITSESAKVAANAEVMRVVNPRAAARGFVKAEKFSVNTAKKAVLKSGEYKASKKAGITAASVLDSIEHIQGLDELDELLSNTPEDILEDMAAGIFDEQMVAPSEEEAATAAASTTTEQKPVQTVDAATSQNEPVKQTQKKQQSKVKSNNIDAKVAAAGV